MKKSNLSSLLVMGLVTTNSFTSLTASMLLDVEEKQQLSTQQFLNPLQRPENIQKIIDDTYKKVSQNSPSWRYNGSSDYNYFCIDPKEMIETLIKASPDQKNFYVLDIGAGDFSWGKNVVTYLNNLAYLPKDITIHIISVTGENYGGISIDNIGKCKQYNLDTFKIEDLHQSFKKLDLDLDKKLDLVVSNYTFVHLHDPVGTFVQVYNLMRPGLGLIMTQGFPVFYDSEPSLNSLVRDCAIIDLLLQTKAPFLTGNGQNRNVASFLLKRPDEKPLLLPLKYAGEVSIELAQTYKKPVVYFEDLSKSKILVNPPASHKSNVLGDYDLFEWIWNNYPRWQTHKRSWEPVIGTTQEAKKKQIIKFPPALFQAVEEQNLEKIKELIDKGEDINQKNALGTPLIFDIFDEKIEKFLISQPTFNPNLTRDDNGQTFAHYILINFDIYSKNSMLEHLLNKSPDLKIQDHLGKTPLYYATQKIADQLERERVTSLLLGGDA